MKEEEGVTKERSIKIRECVCRRQDGNIEKKKKEKGRKKREKEGKKGGRGEGERWKRIKEDT